MLAMMGHPARGANLLTNGGFETGDFSNSIDDGLKVYWEGQSVYDSMPVPATSVLWVPLSFVVTSSSTLSEVKIAAFDSGLDVGIDDVYVAPLRNTRCRPAGDANGDGVVNFADIGAVLSHWGSACPP